MRDLLIFFLLYQKYTQNWVLEIKTILSKAYAIKTTYKDMYLPHRSSWSQPVLVFISNFSDSAFRPQFNIIILHVH